MSRNRIPALVELTFQQGSKVKYLVLHMVARVMRQRRRQRGGESGVESLQL